jgi:RES domain
VVLIAPPPPLRTPDPLHFILPSGSYLLRIFNPTRHNTQALTFRHYGPINRFDHQQITTTGKPAADPERGIYYAGFTLSCCLVEYFGDSGVIEIKDEQVARIQLKRDLQLLDLRGSGSLRAGSVAALAKVADRAFSQNWSRYFYEQTVIYETLDGICYFNAHNDEAAIALYERSKNALSCPDTQMLALNHPSLRPAIQQAALENNLDFLP